MSVANATDESLVRSALEGDQTAYAELFNRLRPLARRTGFRFFGDSAEAVDYEADFLAHVLLRIGSFKGNSKFSTWATSVARNVALMQIRSGKNRRERTMSIDALASDESGERFSLDAKDPNNLHAQFEAAHDLRKILARRPKGHADLIIAADIEGLSGEEIAARNGVGIRTAKARLHRAREAARSAA